MLCQERKRHPVGIGAGLRSETCADIREGRTHCVVWAAGGLGWEKPQRVDASSASGAPLTQQALLEAYLEAQRKAAADLEGFARVPVVVVAMPHGARRAASALHAQGVQTVLWVGESLFEERAVAVLFGLIVPILSKMQQLSWWRLSSDELSHMVVEMGRLVLGGGGTSWDKGGCFHTGLPPLAKWSPPPRNQPWVHNLAPHLPRPIDSAKERVKKVSAGNHESLKLLVELKVDGTRFDLLGKCDTDSLLSWLGAALPLPGDSRQAQELIAALYVDEEDSGAAGVWQPCLQMRLSIGDVGFLHELRDAVINMLGSNPK